MIPYIVEIQYQLGVMWYVKNEAFNHIDQAIELINRFLPDDDYGIERDKGVVVMAHDRDGPPAYKVKITCNFDPENETEPVYVNFLANKITKTKVWYMPKPSAPKKLTIEELAKQALGRITYLDGPRLRRELRKYIDWLGHYDDTTWAFDPVTQSGQCEFVKEMAIWLETQPRRQRKCSKLTRTSRSRLRRIK